MTVTRKKLIEVALPLEAINAACKPESENPFLKGHPRSLHNWWARLPLVASRAVVFCSLVDDPGEPNAPVPYLIALDELPRPEPLPSGWSEMSSAEQRRQRLFSFVGSLVRWESGSDERVLGTARRLIGLACEGTPPPILDPFCGRGSIPLEAQRLGLEAHGADLNPVAVLITKALIEFPALLGGGPPVNHQDRSTFGSGGRWGGAAGIAADVRHYGRWMCEEAEKRIGSLYPKIRISDEMASGRPDLLSYRGKDLTVSAWLWARTVKCPNPACGIAMPLLSSFILSSKRGKEAYLLPVLGPDAVTFKVGRIWDPQLGDAAKGYKRGVSGIFECARCGTVTTRDYVASKGVARELGVIPTAVVAEGARQRVYLPAPVGQPELPPVSLIGLDVPLAPNPRDVWCRNFGLETPADLFTHRQLVALTTFSDLVAEARKRVRTDAVAAGLADEGTPLHKGGTGAEAYADAVAVYLGCAVSRMTDYHSTLCTWNPTNENISHVFVRQALPMVWDYAEANAAVGQLSLEVGARWVAEALASVPPTPLHQGEARQADATEALPFAPGSVCVSTDPPYYDNIGYADLADYFYVWLRRCLAGVLPDLFQTVVTPKAAEIVASSYRHDGGAQAAHAHFSSAMTSAFQRIREVSSPHHPATVVYAYKEEEMRADSSSKASGTGWEAMLETLVAAGFLISGTWPMRTSKKARAVAQNTNALASAIILCCRPRSEFAGTATRLEFLDELGRAMRESLPALSSGYVSPVDLAQASIGPGMAVYSKYAAVIRQDGKPVAVRDALQDINNAIAAYRTERVSSFDPKTRFCIDFYTQFGFGQSEFDQATVLARAQAVGVDTLENEHLLTAEKGRAALVPLGSYPIGLAGLERRFGGSAWEACMRLASTLQEAGEPSTAALARELGEGVCARARELAVWLFTIANAHRRSQDAVAFNALDASWPEIQRLMASMNRGGQQGRFA